MSTFVAPKFQSTGFTCPHCNAFAKQEWEELYTGEDNGSICKSECDYCSQLSVWFGGVIHSGGRWRPQGGNMIYPDMTNIPAPNEDLSDEIKNDYLEASSIITRSPRGACALLRLALQKLMLQLGEKGVDINVDIGNLVKRGLSPTIQQALDTVRIVGNESVHPGTIDMKDNQDIAVQIFGLINIIAEFLITQPRKIAEIYATLPPNKLQGIETRDS